MNAMHLAAFLVTLAFMATAVNAMAINSPNHLTRRHTPHYGHFKVLVRYAHNIPNTDRTDLPDLYVKVIAITPEGAEHPKTTRSIQNTANPEWNVWLDWHTEGCDWTHFKVQVWDSDRDRHDDLVFPEGTFDVEPGRHTDVQHCIDTSCRGYVLFDHQLLSDEEACRDNPCQNGGTYTCTNRNCDSYTCECPPMYEGTQCEHKRGRLQVFARNGHDLPDTDRGVFQRDSDPYMAVIAFESDGHSVRRVTRHDTNDDSPEWNQNLDFGVGLWTHFEVRLWDEDPTSADDALSDTQTVRLPTSSIRVTHVHHAAHRGGAYFDYSFF